MRVVLSAEADGAPAGRRVRREAEGDKGEEGAGVQTSVNGGQGTSEFTRINQTACRGRLVLLPDVESPDRYLSSQVRGGDIETEKRLRKDLKRTKALLVDAQIMLDHIKNNAPSKREIAQLKNQVSSPGGG